MSVLVTDHSDDVRRYLEESGYVVDRPRPTEPSLLLARHARRPPLVVKVFPGVLRFNTLFRVGPALRADRLRLLEAVNEFNRCSLGACACVNLRGELAVEALLYSGYDRVTFNDFLRRVWDRELDRLVRDPAFADLEPHETAPVSHERL